ncbi:hypothetical protein CALVIDRAFT_380346 [Calocera viscosa TUFC12733]|uniref:MARVEL domain-containing protein n=1 Tax=Calocera viscosa (strain TUFC12733) TaxID=1330018 RepID=A0A167Q4Y6_CALVF|nr:hypothetical protein CALVIDRAFT_380346 [Calocera viscosa TUFC12733]
MLRRFRIFALVICTVFGTIVFGISTYITWYSYPDFSIGIATGVLLVIACPTVLAIDWWRRSVFTSWTSVELAWMGVLWVLSLSTGAMAINDWQVCKYAICVPEPGMAYVYECSGPPKPICGQVQAVAGFSIMTCIILLLLWSWTLYVGIRAHIDGDPFIWTSPAHEYEFMPTFSTHGDIKQQPTPEISMSDRPSRTRTPDPTSQRAGVATGGTRTQDEAGEV